MGYVLMRKLRGWDQRRFNHTVIEKECLAIDRAFRKSHDLKNVSIQYVSLA